MKSKLIFAATAAGLILAGAGCSPSQPETAPTPEPSPAKTSGAVQINAQMKDLDASMQQVNPDDYSGTGLEDK